MHKWYDGKQNQPAVGTLYGKSECEEKNKKELRLSSQLA